MIFKWAAFRRVAVLWLLLVLLMPVVIRAQVPVPPLLGHITDETGTLAPDQIASLEQKLVAFEKRKGSQLAVLIVASTAPEDIAQFSLRVVEQWKLGRKKVDDGVLLIVAKNDRTLRIEVGYGLEGVLSDIISQRIIRESIVPLFKQRQFYAGITAGVDQIMRVVDGEPMPEPQANLADDYQGLRQFAPFFFIVAIALGGMLRRVLGQFPGALVTGVVVTVLAWFVIGTLYLSLLAGLAAVVMTLIGLRPWQQGIGYSGRGGFGGGGFGGSGGGFGGGGASGRW